MADFKHPNRRARFVYGLLISCTIFNFVVFFVCESTVSTFYQTPYIQGVVSRSSGTSSRPPSTSIPILQDNNNITIVTAYFNLGTISKGTEGNYITERMFFRWAKSFRHLDNPVIVYTDCKKFLKYMNHLRKTKSSRTVIKLIDRESSWAFQNEIRIQNIISQKDYPKFVPNTVNSAYICTQHVKYDVIQRAARDNPFQTKYFAWLDVGYFRNKTDHGEFVLKLPRDFDATRISVNQVNERNSSAEPENIFKENLVWIGGGLFLGERCKMIEYADQFKAAVSHFLDLNLGNTDQQTIYAMFSKSGVRSLKPNVHLQVYSGHFDVQTDKRWFYLGYEMIRELSK